MELKDKLQQVLVARNCWRMDKIPKLLQRESQAQMKMSRFPLLASGGMVSSNAWRMKKPKLEQHNTNAADEIF